MVSTIVFPQVLFDGKLILLPLSKLFELQPINNLLIKIEGGLIIFIFIYRLYIYIYIYSNTLKYIIVHWQLVARY